MTKAPLRHRIELVAYLGVVGLLRSLPHRTVLRFGHALGAIAAALDVSHRRVALQNLAHALPELTGDRRRRIVRSCFRHFGRAFCEVISVARFDEGELRRHFRIEGQEHFEAARAQDRGVLLISGHFGCWQVAIYSLGLLAGGLHVVARPPDNPHVARRVLRLRERHGVHVVGGRGAGHRLVTLLRRKAVIGMLVDHRPTPGAGVSLPFLGRPARTSTVPAVAAAYCGTPAVPMGCTPSDDGGYTIRLGPPIPPGGRDAEAIKELTRRYARTVEDQIRERPELWFWMHDRWKD